jgi:protein TonB
MARTARVQGTVTLEVEVDEEGNVASVTPVDGPALLRQAAVDAVRQWIYSPTLLNGEPVPVTSTVRVNFSLN